MSLPLLFVVFRLLCHSCSFRIANEFDNDSQRLRNRYKFNDFPMHVSVNTNNLQCEYFMSTYIAAILKRIDNPCTETKQNMIQICIFKKNVIYTLKCKKQEKGL